MKLISIWLAFIFLFTIIFGCEHEPKNNKRPKIGPDTKNINTNTYQSVFYVSISTGKDDQGDGSANAPWKTIGYTLSRLSNRELNNRYAIFVAKGTYRNGPIKMLENIDLYGGFNPANWQRDIETYMSVLSGEEKDRVMIGANNALIDGFMITKGLVRDKGAAISCDQASPTITNNFFVNNQTLSPIPWNPKYIHETANDGGAIYCSNRASPLIANNLFIHNKTENGRGAGVALDNKCHARLINNVFIENISGLKDPMRSSDGGAISVFDWSDPVIKNNIVMNNKALSKNDGGGIFVALWSSAVINKNIIVGNHSGDDAGGIFIGGQEHRYDKPFDPMPPKDKFYVEVNDNIIMGNSHAGHNSGAMRITMESRGLVSNNIIARNSGVYFQRSELQVSNNTILENVLVTESKENLKPIVLRNNLIWGDFIVETDAIVTDNNIKNGFDGAGNYSSPPVYSEQETRLKPTDVKYHPARFFTTLDISDFDYHNNELVNRILQAGTKWGVVKSNSKNKITIWGDFSGEKVFILIPTYRL